MEQSVSAVFQFWEFLWRTWKTFYTCKWSSQISLNFIAEMSPRRCPVTTANSIALPMYRCCLSEISKIFCHSSRFKRCLVIFLRGCFVASAGLYRHGVSKSAIARRWKISEGSVRQKLMMAESFIEGCLAMTGSILEMDGWTRKSSVFALGE